MTLRSAEQALRQKDGDFEEAATGSRSEGTITPTSTTDGRGPSESPLQPKAKARLAWAYRQASDRHARLWLPPYRQLCTYRARSAIFCTLPDQWQCWTESVQWKEKVFIAILDFRCSVLYAFLFVVVACSLLVPV